MHGGALYKGLPAVVQVIACAYPDTLPRSSWWWWRPLFRLPLLPLLGRGFGVRFSYRSQSCWSCAMPYNSSCPLPHRPSLSIQIIRSSLFALFWFFLNNFWIILGIFGLISKSIIVIDTHYSSRKGGYFAEPDQNCTSVWILISLCSNDSFILFLSRSISA